MKIPSTLWVAILLILPPMLIPVVEKFAPSNTYWWSALIVVLLNAIVLIVKAGWPTQAVTVVPPVGTMGAPIPPSKPVSEKHGLAAKLFVYGV